MEPLTLSDTAGLLWLAGRATIILAVALLLSRALRKGAAATRHVLWTATFALLLGLPIATAWLPAWELPVLPFTAEGPSATVVVQGLGASTGAASLAPEPSTGPVVRRREGATAAGAPGSRSARPRAGAALGPGADVKVGSATGTGPGPISLALLLWAVGSAAAIVSVTLGTLRFRALVRDADVVRNPVWQRQLARLRLRLGIDREVRLLVSSTAHTPMTGGWGRPLIVLPISSTTWTPERREVVLVHELVHVRRHDALRQLLGHAALALYWFHPLSWIASRHAAVSREQACDEAVLELGTRPSEYAGHLLALAEGMHLEPALASLPMIQPSQLERRIMSILAPRRPRASAPATGALVFLIGGLGLSAAVAHPVESAPPAERAASARVPGPAGRGPVRQMVPLGETPVPRAAVGSPGPAIVSPEPLAVVRQEPSCRADGWSGNFSGTIRASGDDDGRREERSGWQNGDRLIQRYVDDVRLCMRIHGEVVMTDDGREVRAIGRGGWIVLEAEDEDLQRLVITEGAGGVEHAWSVGGRERAFDDDARAWRDHMFTVLAAYWEASRLRGQESTLRGRISSHRGHISSLRGRISSARGHISSLRGQISSARGHVSSLGGRISSLRGHVSSLNGAISTHRGRISSLRSAMRASESTDTRARLEDEIAEQEARIREVERERDEFELERRVAEVEGEIDAYDLHARVRRIEAEIDAYDLEGKTRGIEQEMEDYDLDGKIRELEGEIEALDADRRAEELERGIAPDLAALRRLIEGS